MKKKKSELHNLGRKIMDKEKIFLEYFNKEKLNSEECFKNYKDRKGETYTKFIRIYINSRSK